MFKQSDTYAKVLEESAWRNFWHKSAQQKSVAKVISVTNGVDYILAIVPF